MSLTQPQIDQMTFWDGKGSKFQDLLTGFKSCIIVFQHYVQHVVERLGRQLTIDDWYKLDEIDFSKYRIYVYNPNSDSKESSLLHQWRQIFRNSEIPLPSSSKELNAIFPPLFHWIRIKGGMLGIATPCPSTSSRHLQSPRFVVHRKNRQR